MIFYSFVFRLNGKTIIYSGMGFPRQSQDAGKISTRRFWSSQITLRGISIFCDLVHRYSTHSAGEHHMNTKTDWDDAYANMAYVAG